MYSRKLIMTRPSTDVPFFGAETKAAQDAFFKQRVEHSAFVAAFYSLSADGLVYTRVSVFTSEQGFQEICDAEALDPTLSSFLQTIIGEGYINKIRTESSAAELVELTDFADMVQMDLSKTMTENIQGLAL